MTGNKKKHKFTHYFIIFLTSFLLGFLLNNYLKINFDYDNIFSKNNQIIDDKKLENKVEDLNLSNFWEVYNLIKENYYDHDNLKKEDLVS